MCEWMKDKIRLILDCAKDLFFVFADWLGKQTFESPLTLFATILTVAGVYIAYKTYRYKSHDDKIKKCVIVFSDNKDKIIPKNLLSHINIGTSLSVVREELGIPNKDMQESYPIPTTQMCDFCKEGQSRLFFYAFKNVNIIFDFKDGDFIEGIYLRSTSSKSPIILFDMMELGKTSYKKAKKLAPNDDNYMMTPANYSPLFDSCKFNRKHAYKILFFKENGTFIYIIKKINKIYSLAAFDKIQNEWDTVLNSNEKTEYAFLSKSDKHRPFFIDLLE